MLQAAAAGEHEAAVDGGRRRVPGAALAALRTASDDGGDGVGEGFAEPRSDVDVFGRPATESRPLTSR